MQFSRNNTNFTTQIFEYFKQTKWDTKYSFLKYYQNIVRSYMNDIRVESKGLLIAHSMGLGKSILAISIAMDLMEKYDPIILLTKSLQENMKSSIHKYIAMRYKMEPDYHLGRLPKEDLNAWIEKNFSYVSMNASNMLSQMNKAAEGYVADELSKVLEKKIGKILKTTSLNGKLLIIDEAHNFFRAITNGSKNAIGLYDAIMQAKDVRLLFLSGTPIANDVFELVPCFNMLAGKPILPEGYKDFYNLFVDEKHKIVKNKERFQNRILGLVSYVNHKSTPGAAFNIIDPSTAAEFPEELPMIVERVNMDPEQYVSYQLARDKEKEEGGFGGPGNGLVAPLVKPKGKSASTYRVKSRQLGNYAPVGMGELGSAVSGVTPNPDSAKFRRILANIKRHPGQLGLVYSQFIGIGGLGIFAEFLKLNGWEQVSGAKPAKKQGGYTDDWWLGGDNDDTTNDTDITSNNTNDTNVSPNNTNDTNVSPNNTNNKSNITNNNKSTNDVKKKFAIISGDVDVETRTAIQNMFNSDENKYGGIIDLILVSSMGAEGLDLKNGRHIHIMEMYWNWGRIMQIIFRFVRTNSHISLKADEKNVQPYIYLAIPPESEKEPNGSYPLTTDVELYNEAITNLELTDAFNDAIHEVSIECVVNGEKNCRVCNPTDSKLYTDNIYADIRNVDPCTEINEEKIIATEIEYKGLKYYYTPDEASIYDYRIYSFDENINGYRPLRENNPIYQEIVDYINNH